jgi:hypothetical protein
MRLILCAALSATVSLSPFVVPMPAAEARQVSPSTPRELSKIRSEFAKVRDRMLAVQRDFDRAARNNLPAVRDAALKDWQRALDGVEPYARQLSAEVPEEAALLDEYNHWLQLYSDAAGPGNAGDFFLQITRHWSELTAGTEAWDQETPALTFDGLTKADESDASARALGMPKTVAFVNAVDKYITDVTARDDYPRYKGSENVKADLAQAEKVRTEAQQKLAKAANAVLDGVKPGELDQASRDRLERFVEQDLATALAGSEAQTDLQSRGRSMLYDYDKKAIGEPAAMEKAMVRLTTAAERDWPRILARYATVPMAPEGSGRGQVVKISGVQNRAGKEFQDGTYDFAGFVDGAPVVGNYAPGVKEHVERVLRQTNTKALPDVNYELVTVIRGTAQVPAVTRPGATTAPATADDATAATSPAVTDCTVLDIVALRAGPACVGTEVVVTPEQ